MSSAAAIRVTHPSLPEYEIEAEAEAGISLTDGSRWWGTRVRYRQPPTRRWQHVVLIDVHPFDSEKIAFALGEVVTGSARSS